jgi:hypothetical protein
VCGDGSSWLIAVAKITARDESTQDQVGMNKNRVGPLGMALGNGLGQHWACCVWSASRDLCFGTTPGMQGAPYTLGVCRRYPQPQ